ncbi:unnamed protein product [Blepharisma stoltei]|uniref:Uncharacterized protein n=1 Tax=Blepharisma stoltei TaxID=1481888 RepID=A0AAU9JGK1_9CILI|nr:unnamed protein product [Blepharisma stoltei]
MSDYSVQFEEEEQNPNEDFTQEIHSPQNMQNSIEFTKSPSHSKSKPVLSKLKDESTTIVAEDPVTLQSLRRENTKLRAELKDLNQRLNTFIELAEFNKKQKPVIINDEALQIELDSAKKKLVLYENESKNLLDRVIQISDPEYEVRLKDWISEYEGILQSKDMQMRINELKQYKRDKALNNITETGETSQLRQEFAHLSSEIEVVRIKLQKVEEKQAFTDKRYKEITDLIEQYNDEQKTLLQHPYVKDAEKLENEQADKEKHKNLWKKYCVREREYKTKIRDLSQKISELEEAIEKIDKKEVKIKSDIQEKDLFLKKFQNDIGNMKEFVMKSISGNAFRSSIGASVKDLREFYLGPTSTKSATITPKPKLRIR